MRNTILLTFSFYAFCSCQNKGNNNSENQLSAGNTSERKDIAEYEIRSSNANVNSFLHKNEKLSKVLEWIGNKERNNLLVFSERTYETSDESAIVDSIVLESGEKVPVYDAMAMAKSKTIYVRHILDGQVTLIDSVSETECIGDIVLQYLTTAVHVTDVDSDNVPEFWIPFVSDCMSSVAPIHTRVIVYVGNSKCDMSGTIYHETSETKSLEIKPFPDCITKNKLMKDYANKVWNEIRGIDIFN